LSIFQKLFTNVVLSVAEYPTKPVLVLSKVQTSQNFGRIAKKKWTYRKLSDQILFIVFKAESPKNLTLEWPKLMAQWPIFSTKLAENFCLEFATLVDATVGAD
jgi:hypothetical protein